MNTDVKQTSKPSILSKQVAAIILMLALMIAPLGLIAASPATFPETIPLPNAFQPEGIASGNGSTFFVGSLAGGSIYKGDLRTGAGEILSMQTDRVSVGMAYDPRSNYLFVAGGPTGMAYIYDASSGETIETYQLTGTGSFINDVVVNRSGAYFTNSFQSYLYEIPLRANGQLPDPSQVREIPLGGDFMPGPSFSANGIDATPNGKWLVIVNSSLGTLYRVDPQTGLATEIDLGGDKVFNGDGILLDGGRTLYVVQNQDNKIAVVDLNDDLTAGSISGYLTSANFDVPTTIAKFGDALYAVNARFGIVVTPDTTYDVVRVSK
jgi:WD40 repeat protein